MTIRYKNTLDSIQASNLVGFFQGWPSHPNKENHFKILHNSYKIWLALDGDKCVGFINAL